MRYLTRLYISIPLLILIVVLVLAPWILWYRTMSDCRETAEGVMVLSSFVQSNPAAQVEVVTTLDKVYVVQWRLEEESTHLSVLVGGRWFDLGEVVVEDKVE